MTTSTLNKCVKGGLLLLASLAFLFTLAYGVFEQISKFKSRDRTYNISYVNYYTRNDVDAGFEAYLNERKIKHKITYYSTDRNPDKLKTVAADIAKDENVDLIVTWGTTVTLGVFGTIVKPSSELRAGVFVLVTSPVQTQIVHSNEDPGRNITGSWHVAPVSNQLRTMLAYKPTSKIGVLYTPSEQNSLVTVKEITRQAMMIGVEIVAIPFDFADGQPVSGNAVEALAKMKANGIDWLYLPPDSFLGTQARSLVIPEAHRLGILTFASTEQLMLAGATAGLIAPYYELGLLTGQKVEQILIKRMNPSSVPVTTVDRFEHMVNGPAAEKLGIDLKKPIFSEVKIIP